MQSIVVYPNKTSTLKLTEKEHNLDCLHDFFVDYGSGHTVCKLCGLVEDTLLLDSSSRGFISPLEPGRKIKQFIGNSQSLQRLNRALRFDKMRPWSLKKIDLGLNEIRRLTAFYLLVSQIQDFASHLFKKAIKNTIFKAHYVILLANVCFYHSARQNQYPLRLSDLIEPHSFSARLSYRYYHTLKKTFNLSNPVITVFTHIPKICNLLKLDEEFIQLVGKIISVYSQQINSSGKDFKGIVAGAIYFASKLLHIPRSQSEICQSADISDITLRARFKEIKKVCLNHGIAFFIPESIPTA